jgi:hypothetical protein
MICGCEGSPHAVSEIGVLILRISLDAFPLITRENHAQAVQ